MHAAAFHLHRTRADVMKPRGPPLLLSPYRVRSPLRPSRSPSSEREGRLGNRPGRASGRRGVLRGYLPQRRRRSRGGSKATRAICVSPSGSADWTHLCVGNWTSPPDHSPVRLASARRPSARKVDSTATACSGRPDRHEGIRHMRKVYAGLFSSLDDVAEAPSDRCCRQPAAAKARHRGRRYHSCVLILGAVHQSRR